MNRLFTAVVVFRTLLAHALEVLSLTRFLHRDAHRAHGYLTASFPSHGQALVCLETENAVG